MVGCVDPAAEEPALGFTADALYGAEVTTAPGADAPQGAVGIVRGPTEPGLNTFGECSGSLVGRDTVVFAAHCLCHRWPIPGYWDFNTEANASEVTFRIPETAGQPAVGEIAATVVWYSGNSSFCPGDGARAEEHASTDLACIRLAQPVPLGAAPVLPLYTGALLYPPALNTWAIGYGGTSWDANGDGIRRIGPVYSYAIDSDPDFGAWYVSHNVDEDGGTTVAHGDSGGPLYVWGGVETIGIIGVSSMFGWDIFGATDFEAWSPTGGVDNGAWLREHCIDDDDNDGVSDENDNCNPDEHAACALDPSVCSNFDQADDDLDGAGNACDNCPAIPNENQNNADYDGKGDVCDPCPHHPYESSYDPDYDGVPYDCDNCDFVPNYYPPCTSDADCDGFCLLGGLAPHCDSQPDADGDGLGDDCDSCPLHSADTLPILANSNSDAEVREGAEELGDPCDPVLTYSSRPIAQEVTAGPPDVAGDEVGPKDVVMFSTAAAVGQDLPDQPHVDVAGSVGFRVCGCHDLITGEQLKKDDCLIAFRCTDNPNAFNNYGQPGEHPYWKPPSASRGWSDAGGYFEKAASWSGVVPDLSLQATFSGATFTDPYVHPDLLEDEPLRLGHPGVALLGWHWSEDAAAVGAYNEGTELHAEALWWDHVPVEGGYVSPRDQGTAGRLRDHYTYVTAPLTYVPHLVQPTPEASRCLYPGCVLVLRKNFLWLIDPPPERVYTFADYLPGPARVIAHEGALVALGSPGEAAYDVSAELGPALRALIGSSTTFLTPVETESAVRRLGDRTHAVAIPSPWSTSARVTEIVAGKGTLEASMKIGGEPGLVQSLAQPGLVPSERQGARGLLTLTERSLFLVGGERPDGKQTGEIWRYRLDLQRWEPLLLTRRNRPSEVLAAAYDPALGKLLVADERVRPEHPARLYDSTVPGGWVDGPDVGPAVRSRLLLVDPGSGQASVVRSCPRSSNVSRVALVARGDGSFLLIAFRAAQHDWTAWRLTIDEEGELVWGGKLKGRGDYLDDPFAGDDGVVLPLLDGGAQRLLTITGAMLGAGSPGCNAF